MRFVKMAWACETRLRRLRIPSLSVFLAAAAVTHGPPAAPASTASTPIICAPAAARDLNVHVIDEAGADPRTLDAAKAEASRIWARAGLRLTWSGPPVPFDLTDGRTVIVMVRRALSPARTLDAADSDACAWLLFDADGRPGPLIEVSFEKLTSLVMRGSELGRPVPTLPGYVRMPLLGRGLGRVVAHEIGHWLMGRGHTQEGLMRASFRVRDLLDTKAARLPRAWTAAGSEQQLALASRLDEAGIDCAP